MSFFRLVLITVLVCFLTTGCDNGAKKLAIAAAEEEITQMRETLKKLDAEKKSLNEEKARKAKWKKAGDSLTRESESLDKNLQEAREYIKNLEEGDSKLEGQLKQWRKPVQLSFTGRRFERLVTAAGKVYKEVEIISVDREFVTFKHQGGEQTERLSDLAPGSQLELMVEKSIEDRVDPL